MTNYTRLQVDPASVTTPATRAAAAAAEVLPSVTPLTVGQAEPGNPEALRGYVTGCVARLPALGGDIAILVGEELVSVLESSPLQGLDLGATLQPALDAAAAVLDSNTEAARQMSLDLIFAALGSPFTVVKLIGTGFAGALLIPDRLLTEREPAPDTDPNAFTPAPGVLNPLEIPELNPRRGIEMLHGVDMELTVELGRARMTVRELLALSPGAVIELDRSAGSPADLLVNGRLIARGEVVVVDEDFGLRITEIIDTPAA